MRPGTEASAELRRRFNSHAIDSEQSGKIAQVRMNATAMGEFIIAVVPEGREQALALTHLEQAAFVAIAGIARPAAEA